jgi:hypothetical protein
MEATVPTPKKLTIPKNLADLADQYFQARQKRLEIDKESDAQKVVETALRKALLENLEKSGATAIGGKRCRVTLTSKIVPTVANWDAFYAYVAKSKQFFLLQKRVSTAAVAELWDAGTEVPGVNPLTVTDLSISAL